MRFSELEPGDVMDLAGHTGVLIATGDRHPLNPSMCLLVWYVFDKPKGRISIDMINPLMELIPGSRVYRDGMASFRRALEEMRR